MKKIGFVILLALLTLTSCYNKSNTLSQTNDNFYNSNKGNASNKNYNSDSIKKVPSSLKENTYSYTHIFLIPLVFVNLFRTLTSMRISLTHKDGLGLCLNQHQKVQVKMPYIYILELKGEQMDP